MCAEEMAPDTRSSIALTVPGDIETPMTSRNRRLVSRRDRRKTPTRAAVSAQSRGPKGLAVTPLGSEAVDVAPQSVHRARCNRCSVTWISRGGTSKTCWRVGARSIGTSTSLPHALHSRGRWSSTPSTSDSSTSLRVAPLWPGCAPWRLSDGGLRRRRFLDHDGSEDGGREEVRESRRRRLSRSSIRAACRSITSACSAIVSSRASRRRVRRSTRSRSSSVPTSDSSTERKAIWIRAQNQGLNGYPSTPRPSVAPT